MTVSTAFTTARIYFLRQLKRKNIPSKELLTFYTTCVRPVAEYACPVFHNGLPQYLSNDLERLQKRGKGKTRKRKNGNGKAEKRVKGGKAEKRVKGGKKGKRRKSGKKGKRRKKG